MCYKDTFLRALFLLSCTSAAIVASQTAASRCFQFTWLGPRYNNESTFLNATCDDATRLSGGVPCQHPLVASYDGTWPDVDYIWTNYPNTTCILASNDICAQYTYYFDGVVENSTYMCTRALDASGSAMTSGCYQQVNGSFTTKVCLCRSVAGGVPCNSAISNTFISSFVMISAVALFINRNLFGSYVGSALIK